MINRLSPRFNTVPNTAPQFDRLASKGLEQQRAPFADPARHDSPVNTVQTRAPAITTNEMAILIQSLTALIQLLEQFVKSQGRFDEKAVVIKPVKPDVPQVREHEVSKKPERQLFTHMSSKEVGEKPSNIWLEFNRRNRHADNESSVKAAMLKYGQSPRSVYSHVKVVGSDYEIIMRDGFKLKLSPQEIAQTQKRINIWSPKDPEMAKDINFMVAASIKRIQLEDGLDSYARALEFVESGKDAGNGFKRLGLEAYVRRTTWPELHASRGTGVVLGVLSGVQLGHDGNVDCCSTRSSITLMTKTGQRKPHPSDAIELI
jgi:hypothetical protein